MQAVELTKFLISSEFCPLEIIPWTLEILTSKPHPSNENKFSVLL